MYRSTIDVKGSILLFGGGFVAIVDLFQLQPVMAGYTCDLTRKNNH